MKRLCTCGRLVEKGERCPCQVERATASAKQRDAARPNAAQRGYDQEWRTLRAKFIKANPLCAFCGAPAKHVDHVETIRARPDLRLSWSNLRPLCHSCHSRHTATSLPFG